MIEEAGRRLLAPRVVLGTLWSIFVALGAWWLSCNPPKATEKPKPESYVAVHAMPTNYRLRKSDLKRADGTQGESTLSQYLGKHLLHDVSRGDAVAITDLRAKPTVTASAGKQIYQFSLSDRPDLIETLNTGSRIDLFQNTQSVLRRASVLAVQCDGPANTNCAAILDLDSNEEKNFLTLELAKIRIIEEKP